MRDKTQCGVLTAYLSSVSLQLHLEIQQLFQNQKIYEEIFFYAAFPKLFCFLLIDFHGFGDFFLYYSCPSVFFLPLFAPCSALFCSLLSLSFIYSIFLLSL